MESKILGLLAVGLLAGPMAAQAVGVMVDGKEWRQLTETTNLSWNQVAGVCNTTTGACNGSIGAVSFDGWTWASDTDIRALFELLIEPANPNNFPTVSSNYFAVASTEIDQAIGAGSFTPTQSNAGLENVSGLSRSLIDASTARTASLTNYFDPIFLDTAVLNSGAVITATSGGLGVWLYRPVPEPGTLALLGLGLAGLGLGRRRKAN